MNDQDRQFVRSIFRDPDAEPELPPERTAGNVVPQEGGNSNPTPDADAELRKYTAELFGYDAD